MRLIAQSVNSFHSIHMLYDRSYMRPKEPASIKRASAVTILLVVTIGIFVLQQVINVSFPGDGNGQNAFIREWFMLSAENFKELKVWTVITYAFLHNSYSIWHILFNMVVLFSFGRILEKILGKQSFFVLYFSGAVIGGLAYLFFHLNDSNPVVGASAAVAALMGFFCMHFYERPITFLLFFIVPVNLKPKWILWAFIGVSAYFLLSSELPAIGSRMPGVAHSAHLGGLLTGVVYHRYIYSRQSIYGGFFSAPGIEVPNWFKRRKKTKSKISYKVNRSIRNRDELQKEVDRILDKINLHGFSALNDVEKETLEKAKDLLNR